MPARNLPLIGIGPARGLDTSSAGEYVAPGDAAANSNVATDRVTGSLCNELGRTQITLLTHYPGYVITAVVPYATSATDQQYLMSVAKLNGTSPAVVAYDPNTGAQPYEPITDASIFDQGIQFYGIVYTNAGQQYTSIDPTSMYLWQYPIPDAVVQGYSVTTGSGSLPAGTYFYAFTQVVTDATGTAFKQETSSIGDTPLTGPPPPTQPYQFYAVSPSGATSAIITGTFAGTNTDGSTYTTNLYRQSTNTPVWTLVTNLSTNTPYTDNNTDTQIAANQQLVTNDPPPVSPSNLGAIFIHQERTWCFANVQNADTNNQPQTQLWFSELGTPWSFDAAQGALLVGNSATPESPGYEGYGDNPVAGISLGSTATLFKSRSAWAVFGNDPDTYIVSKLFDIGAIARHSVTSALGTVYWLSESGIYAYAGSGPQYISQKIRNTLLSIPLSDQQNCISFFSNLTVWFSFPATGITLGYYIPTGDWKYLPYATQAAFSIAANPALGGSFVTGAAVNEVVAARTDLPILDHWFSSENDLGAPITASWTTGLTYSQQPHIEKEYKFITVTAPYQAGMVYLTLTIDPGSNPAKVHTATFDLANTGGQASTRNIVRISPDLKGFMAQLQVTFVNTTGATTPLSIPNVTVWGCMGRELVVPD